MATVHEDLGPTGDSVRNEGQEITDQAPEPNGGVMDSHFQDSTKAGEDDEVAGGNDVHEDAATQDGPGTKKKKTVVVTRRPVVVTCAEAVLNAKEQVTKKEKQLEEKRAAHERALSERTAKMVAKAEEKLKKAKEQLVTAETKLAAAEKTAESNAEKVKQKEARRQQKINLEALDVEIAAQVVGFILDKKEFYDRNSSDKQVWTNATPVLNNLFATTFSQKKWRTDFTPDEFINIYTTERALYVQAIH